MPRERAPERGPPERLRRLRRDARDHEALFSASSPAPPAERGGELLRLGAGAHRRDRRRRAQGRTACRAGHPSAHPLERPEPFEIGPDTGFVLLGERTNVTGSSRFRGLVEGRDYAGAVEVALEQVRGGANALDVNMDADLLESEQAMRTFLNVIATEPEVARLPIMVDSSRWSVLEAGLQSIQGKGIVNSIRLKEGEEPLLREARRIRD